MANDKNKNFKDQGQKIVIAERDNIAAVLENGKVTDFFQRRKVQGRPSRHRLHTIRKDIKRFWLSPYRSVKNRQKRNHQTKNKEQINKQNK